MPVIFNVVNIVTMFLKVQILKMGTSVISLALTQIPPKPGAINVWVLLMIEGKTHTARRGREKARAEHAVQYAERSLGLDRAEEEMVKTYGD